MARMAVYHVRYLEKSTLLVVQKITHGHKQSDLQETRQQYGFLPLAENANYATENQSTKGENKCL